MSYDADVEPRGLKPCPFCGGDVTERDALALGDDWVVACDGCGAEGPPADTEREAIEAWERRAGA